MINIDGTNCCGIDEISGISEEGNTPEGIVKHVVRHDDIQAHFNFSDVTIRRKQKVKSIGEGLAKYIRKHNLGRVITTPPAVNKNTGNTIKQWTWTPNKRAVKAWYKSKGKNIPDLPD